MTKIISYINLLGCIGWSIAGLVVLIVIIKQDVMSMNKTEAIGFFVIFFALFATTFSGIILFIVGHKKQPENIKPPNVMLVTIIHFLGCIGWSIFGFYGLIETIKNKDTTGFFVVFAIFATTFSGIYLSGDKICNFTQLWKIKKLIILWTGVLIIVIMCLFPPWVYEGEIMGRAYLFSNGKFSKADVSPKIWESLEHGEYLRSINAHVDSARLIIQCAIVGLITGALLYTLKDKKAEGGGKRSGAIMLRRKRQVGSKQIRRFGL